MDGKTYKALTTEYDTLYLLYHKSKNQHHNQKWFMYLNIMIRTLRKILKLQIDIQRIKKSPKKIEYKKKQIVTLCNKVIKISRDAYWAYNSILALGQFITLGFSLLGSLSKIYSLILNVPGVNGKKLQLIESVTKAENFAGYDDGDDLGEEIPFEEDDLVSESHNSLPMDTGAEIVSNKMPPVVSIKIINMLVSESDLKQSLAFKNTYRLPNNQWDVVQKVLQKSLQKLVTECNFEFDTEIHTDNNVSRDQLYKSMEDKNKHFEKQVTDYMINESKMVLSKANEIKKIMIGQLKKLPKKGKGEINVNQMVVSEFTKWYFKRNKNINQKMKEIEDKLLHSFESVWDQNTETNNTMVSNNRELKSNSVDLDSNGARVKEVDDICSTIAEQEISKKRKNETIDDIFGVKKSKKESKSPDNITKKKKKKKKKGSAIDDIFSL